MKNLLRRWLGYNDIVIALDNIREEMLLLRNDLTVTFKDEFDPGRKAMSDRLGQRAMAKLTGEDAARRHTLGEL